MELLGVRIHGQQDQSPQIAVGRHLERLEVFFHTLARQAVPLESEAILSRQFVRELPQDWAVSDQEWLCLTQLSQIECGAFGPLFHFVSFELVLTRETVEQFVQRAFDLSGWHIAAQQSLGKVHIPEFAGEVVQVLKDVLMDPLQVLDGESTRYWLGLQVHHAKGGEVSLGLCQSRGARDA